jgi:hypothetical protein
MRYLLELEKDEAEYLLNLVCMQKAVHLRDALMVLKITLRRNELLEEAPGVDSRVGDKLCAIGERVLEEELGR